MHTLQKLLLLNFNDNDPTYNSNLISLTLKWSKLLIVHAELNLAQANRIFFIHIDVIHTIIHIYTKLQKARDIL